MKKSILITRALLIFSLLPREETGIRTCPFHQFIMFPQTLALRAVDLFYPSLPVAFVVAPIPNIPLPVFPSVASIPVFHVLPVLPFIRLTSRPGVNPSTFHLPLDPISLILPPVTMLKGPLAVKLVIFPLPFIYISCSHFIYPVAEPKTFFVLSFITAPVVPNLSAFAMRLILFPLPLVLLTVFIDKNTDTVCVIIHPLSFVITTIFVREFP